MPVITGTPNNDTLNGGDGADQIGGLGGNDLIDGGGGDDQIDGGDGNDILLGGTGNDVVHGGTGDDAFIESEGAGDQLFGEDGDDRFYFTGAMLDTIYHALLNGGAGDDVINFYIPDQPAQHSGTLIGGDGHDRIRAEGGGQVTIDAGADADLVDFTNFETNYDITLGSGADLMVMESNQFFFSSSNAISVADFTAGISGDTLDLTAYLTRQTFGWDFADNPFGAGFLRLVQRGADTVVQLDRDGGGSDYDFADLITLKSVTAASLTARNLGGYSPNGGVTAGATIDGTAATDFIGGTSGNDLIHGLDGNDGIYGGAGNDRIEGGNGDDTLEGELGDDLLYGGDGNDTLNDVLAGSDSLYGEGGNDSLFVDRQWFPVASSSVLMDGGAGDDRLTYLARQGQDDITILGGTGNDYISAYLGRDVTIDAGDGDDIVLFDIGATNLMITLGAGADMMQPSIFQAAPVAFTVTDFAAGDSGDRFDLGPLLSRLLIDWDPATNPFAGNYLRLAQDGADTLVLFSPEGDASDLRLLARLSGVDAATLTAFNFGYAPGAVAISGTDGDDVLTGTAGADLMIGHAGNDTYFVNNAGDVVVEAVGEGYDTVAAGLNYTLGAGAEIELMTTGWIEGIASINLGGNEFSNQIWGNNGSNAISGGDGDDALLGFGGNDSLDGGDGNDALFGGAGADAMAGGAGDDTIFVDDAGDTVSEGADGGYDTVAAGLSYALTAGAEIELMTTGFIGGTAAINLTGNEFANQIWGNDGANVINGSGGDDALLGFGGNDTLNGGAGNDVLFGGAGADAMAGGTGDDTMFVDDAGDTISEAAGEGYDTVAAGISYTLTAGASIELLTTGFIEGTAAINLTGNELANQIWGNDGSNTLSGGGGDDALLGFGGDDSLQGGAGNDLLVGGAGADAMAGGAGDDTIFIDDAGDTVTELAGEGNDTLAVGFSYSLAAGVSIELMTTGFIGGNSSINLTGNELGNQIWGNDGGNTLLGGGGDDALIAFGGNDIVDGGIGADLLVGGDGNDTFRFTSALGNGNVDLIADFTTGSDRIELDDAVFSGLSLGGLNANAFVTGTAAQDADDRIIYDAATGNLYFDADGNGAGAAVLFATLNGHPPIAASDIVVI